MKTNNFLSFVESKKLSTMHEKAILEAFSKAEIDKVLELVDAALTNSIGGILPLEGFVKVESDGEEFMSKQYIVKRPDNAPKTSCKMFALNWLMSGKSASIYSIDFFNSLDMLWGGSTHATLTLSTIGVSIATIIPLVANIVKKDEIDISRDEVTKIENSSQQTYESFEFKIGSVKYILLENISNNVIKDAFMLEASEAEDMMLDKRNELSTAMHERQPVSLVNKLKKEYEEICLAINDGARTAQEVKIAISRRKLVKELPTGNFSKDTLEAEKELDKTKKDPEQVFKEMRKYIDLVVKGLQSSVIICGAPGVGKTYRVKKQLKEAGYKEEKNMFTFKGKGTPRTLFLALYNYRKKGDIILIDDADALVGPNAPEDSINILKGALDTTSDDEGRLITYGISSKLTDDDGNSVPKKFYYNGSVIIITNYNVGQLDTAIRGRSFIQDISFSINETLSIIKGLMPTIEPDKYSMEAKQKAYDFLELLAIDKTYAMDISVRIFCLCTKLFESAKDDNEFTDEDVRSMIKEQIRNQSMRGGKKY